MRLFVAAWPPPDVLDEVEALEPPEEPGVRWTTRAQWHVTLRFLGRCEPEDATAALEVLADHPGAVSTEARMGPEVSRLGRSVICLPVAGLDALAAAVRDVTASVGEPPDPRPFTGHLTLARLRGRVACGLAGRPFQAAFQVREVALVASDLHPDGARYATLRTWTLPSV
ncbi:MAG: RNA 2',3'-cyclic phosphodiesterase [Acidimicrobiia bacterium]|nr:RNA 2',3'-cyclic phosphodiesterase [Acidimicrobiia bacterium]